MFLDEARLAARIRHPNVIGTLDVVALAGELFLVMEYVPGESFARLWRTARDNGRPIPVPIVIAVMVGVLEGLHAAHDATNDRGEPLGLVHRDVSPHNILVGTDGDAHVIDFGIAKARGRMQVTRQGQIKGKLSYMPSEQLLGQALDHRADVFAASIVLWEALTGQRLFQGTDDGEVYAKVLLGKVDPPSLYARDLSPAIDAIVMRGLARDNTERFATAREMALAIEAAIPLAPPSQVGRWVEGLVGDSLAERTQQIAGIERLDDGGETRMTSSALMSIGGGTPSSGKDQKAQVSSGGTLVSRMERADRTAPTQPVGLMAATAVDAHVTVVDRRERPVAAAESGPQSAGLPRPRRRRALIVAAILLIPIASYGAWRGSRYGETSAAATGAATRTAESPTPSGPPASKPSNDWIPVPAPSPVAQATPPAEASATHKTIAAQAPTTTRPALPRSPTAPQPGENTETATPGPTAPATRGSGASCDPPFWIDSDGTKRYNRHCANL
jgi:serine/threonine-protein kinase